VRILEKCHEFQRLGDSLGLGENALRLLKRWGLYERLLEIGNKSQFMQIRRWEDGKILAQQPLSRFPMISFCFGGVEANFSDDANGRRLVAMAGYIGHRGDVRIPQFLD